MIIKKNLNGLWLFGALVMLSSQPQLFSLSMETNKTISSSAKLSEAELLLSKKMYVQALPILKELANNATKQATQARALMLLGTMAEGGQGMPVDKNQACVWFIQCAEKARKHDILIQTVALSAVAEIFFEREEYDASLDFCKLSIACQSDPENRPVLRRLEDAADYERQNYKRQQAKAHRLLGMIYFNGYCDESNYLKAAKHFEIALEKDPLSADRVEILVLLAQIYTSRDDLVRARTCYQKATEGETADAYHLAFAMMNLARFLQIGSGGEHRDLEKARKIFMAIVNPGFVEHHGNLLAVAYSFMRLGDIYVEGDQAVGLHYTAAKNCYESGAEQAHVPLVKIRCARILGDMYSEGCTGIPRDFEKARKYYELVRTHNNEDKSISDSECMSHLEWSLIRLGDLYFQGGDGLISDACLARDYYHLITENPHVAGLFEWASMREGECLLLNPNRSQINYAHIQQCFENALKERPDLVPAKDAVERDHHNMLGLRGKALASLRLGELHFFGKVGTQDLQKAREYYELAGAMTQICDLGAQKKSWMRLGELHYRLGRLDENQGCANHENYEKAQEYLERVLNDNKTRNPEATARALMLKGKMLLKQRNYEKARLAFETAISWTYGDTISTRKTAHQKLSKIYREGRGTPIDPAKAEAHLKKSKEL